MTSYNRTDDPRIPIADSEAHVDLLRRQRVERQAEADALLRARAERAAQATLAREDAGREAAADFNAARIRRDMRDKEASASRGNAHTARVAMIKGRDSAYVDRTSWVSPLPHNRQDAAPQPTSGASAARAAMIRRLHQGG